MKRLELSPRQDGEPLPDVRLDNGLPVFADVCPGCLGIKNPANQKPCALCRGYGVVCPECRGARWRRNQWGELRHCTECCDVVVDNDGSKVVALNIQRLSDTVTIYRESKRPVRMVANERRYVMPDGEIVEVA
jgi:hypothetical protein